MKNYYFVASFNVSNPIVKAAFMRQKLFSDNIVALKFRSRPYNTFSEASISCHKDFQDKLPGLFEEENSTFKCINVFNPDCLEDEFAIDRIIDDIANDNHLNYGWDENCCSVLFFNEDNGIDEETDPNAWMIKYEVLFYEDGIEHTSNGEYAIIPHPANMSSYLH